MLKDDGSFSEIEKLIEKTADNGTIQLEGKRYGLSSDTHIVLNKSLNFEGLEGTVIEGNNFSLSFNCVEKQAADEIEGIYIYREGYEIKNTGKHITLKNITFANINLVDWHRMDFTGCRFINSTLTNYEMNNTYEKSSFINSNIEIRNPQGFLPKNFTPDYSKIINCEFESSNLTSKNLFLSSYVELVGSSRYSLINKIGIENSSFKKSKLELTYYTVNVSGCNFTDGSWEGWSSKVSINDTNLENQIFDYLYTGFNAENSVLKNGTLAFSGGYFSRGCEVNLKNCEIDDAEFKIDEGINSAKSVLDIEDSKLNNTGIESTFSDLIFKNSSIENTDMVMMHGIALFENTSLINEKKLSQIFRTYNVTFTFRDSYLINSSGKYELDDDDVPVGNLEKIIVDVKDKYFVGDEVAINLIDSKGNPVKGEYVNVNDSSAKDDFYNYTDENGTMKYLLQKDGHIKLIISTPHRFGAHPYKKTVELNVKSIPIRISASSLTTTYKTRGALKIKLSSNSANSTLEGFELTVKVHTGKKCKTYYVVTKANGAATFKTPANLAAGKHKVVISTRDLTTKKVTVTVKKAATTVKAPKVTGNFKKTKFFKVTVKDKKTKKAVSNVNVKIKVYTGKKYVTKTIKTNSKGTVKFNTKTLKKGTHKVVISSGNSNYKISAKSTIIIK